MVNFFAKWCGPCKTMKPILETLKSKIGDKIRILKVDIDKSLEAANAYKVQSVPTLILFHNGVIKWSQSVLLSALNLEQIIMKYCPQVPKNG